MDTRWNEGNEGKDAEGRKARITRGWEEKRREIKRKKGRINSQSVTLHDKMMIIPTYPSPHIRNASIIEGPNKTEGAPEVSLSTGETRPQSLYPRRR